MRNKVVRMESIGMRMGRSNGSGGDGVFEEWRENHCVNKNK